MKIYSIAYVCNDLTQESETQHVYKFRVITKQKRMKPEFIRGKMRHYHRLILNWFLFCNSNLCPDKDIIVIDDDQLVCKLEFLWMPIYSKGNYIVMPGEGWVDLRPTGGHGASIANGVVHDVEIGGVRVPDIALNKKETMKIWGTGRYCLDYWYVAQEMPEYLEKEGTKVRWKKELKKNS